MKRARATALALVNWKGVFYERYLLDSNVTALEGANGAGKTTVMVAAYVVLLPDLSRLRFSNVGESGGGAGDRGLKGRLGDPARPSYAAIEFVSGGEHFVAGVHLAQRGAELAMTPFSFSGVSLDGSLKELLLITTAEHDEVPELAQVKERAAALGGTFVAYPSAKEYFAALFERGIFPLRLQIDEERKNWNELLRTSMSGGISRALTSELRSFLLREETGLSDTLQRMRVGLDSCRRTRAEVRESTRLEGEIGGVYEAGLAMFEAAVAGRHAFQASTLAALATARDDARKSQLAKEEAVRAIETARAQEAQAAERLAQGRSQAAAQRAADEARERAAELAREIDGLRRDDALAAEAVAVAHTELASVQVARDDAHAAQARARSEYEDAAVGMADLQEGLEELHHVVHTARRRRELDERIAALTTTVAPEHAAARVTELDSRLVSLERRHAGHTLGRARYESAAALLARLGTNAEQVLAEHAQDVAKSELASQLAHEAARAHADLAVYAEARALAASAGVEVGPGIARRTREALAACRTELRAATASLAEAERRAQEPTTPFEAELAERRERLVEDTAGHAEISALARFFECERGSSALQLRGHLASRLVLLERERGVANQIIAECTRDLERLESDAPLRLAEALGGEVLASRFDEVDDETAARIEAELGPVAAGIVVDDLASASAKLTSQDVVLVRADAAFGAGQRSTTKDGAVWVTEPYGLRVVPVDAVVTLGKGRRARHAATLRTKLAAQHEVLAGLATLETKLHAWTERLAHATPIELAADAPDAQIVALEAELAEARAARAAAAGEAQDCQTRVDVLVARETSILALSEHARMLELPAPDTRADAADAMLQSARDAEARVAARGRDVAELALVVDVLRDPPEPADQLERAVHEARAERDAAWQLAAVVRERDALGPAPRAEDVTAAEAALERGTGARATTQALWQERKRALAAAEAAAARADATLSTATQTWQRATLDREAVARRLAERSAAYQPPPPSQDALFGSIDVAAAELAYAEAMAARVRAEEQARAAHDAAIAAISWEAESEESAAEKSAVFEHFEAEARAAKLQYEAPTQLRDYKESFAEADGRGRLLMDRLQTARGGETAAETVGALLQQGSYVAAWVHARGWLTERLPLALADLPDPHSALDRLRTQLAELEATLSRQETDLRGASGDVARGIDVRVRRAKATVRRMNQHLGKVQFGSVSGIKVDLVRVAKMDAVLEAMREGQAQELLFDPTMPIEQAFEEIFRRFAGGGRGADRLLDYREYLELVVLVQRRGKPDWEIASPARLSTGEAIGVGASLLMVVLTEWEQSSQMFRKASSGSLRFLFLDEANRLSSDNLGVLFELCEKLELQLLLAAPEVAQAQGNTTYRLVRRVDEAGREEVVVSGRRLVPGSASTPVEADERLFTSSLDSEEESS